MMAVQVSRVTPCTSAGPPVGSRKRGGRSESNADLPLFFYFLACVSIRFERALLFWGLGVLDECMI